MGREKLAGRRGRGAGEPRGATRGARGWETLGPAAEGRRARTTVQRGVLSERGGGVAGRDRSRADGVGGIGVGGIPPYFSTAWSAGAPPPNFLYCCYRSFTIKCNLKYNHLCIERKFWKDLGRKSLGQLVFILFQA